MSKNITSQFGDNKVLTVRGLGKPKGEGNGRLLNGGKKFFGLRPPMSNPMR
jgi:hypothetical protein